MIISDITSAEYGLYYQRYLDMVPKDQPVTHALKVGYRTMIQYIESLNEERGEYRYRQDKWTIKEVMQHMIDTERVFAHRMFRIGRHDIAPLPGFDQDMYMAPAGVSRKTVSGLKREYESTRNFTLSILTSLSDKDLKYVGSASGAPLSPRAAAFIIAGHELWHLNILRTKYA